MMNENIEKSTTIFEWFEQPLKSTIALSEPGSRFNASKAVFLPLFSEGTVSISHGKHETWASNCNCT